MLAHPPLKGRETHVAHNIKSQVCASNRAYTARCMRFHSSLLRIPVIELISKLVGEFLISDQDDPPATVDDDVACGETSRDSTAALASESTTKASEDRLFRSDV